MIGLFVSDTEFSEIVFNKIKATQEFSKIQWAYATNITDFNEQKQLEYTVSFIYTM